MKNLHRQKGAGTVEQGLLVGLIAVTVLVGLSTTGEEIKSLFNKTAGSMHNSLNGIEANWVQADSEFTDWTNTANTKNETAWSPAIAAQPATFSQSRNVEQEQERLEQKKQRNIITGNIRNDGDPIRHTQFIPSSENRTVNVVNTGWVDVGAPYSCGGWSPAPSSQPKGQSFTQTSSCQQNRQRNILYMASGLTSDSKAESGSYTKNSYQQATGTKGGVWVNTGGGRMTVTSTYQYSSDPQWNFGNLAGTWQTDHTPITYLSLGAVGTYCPDLHSRAMVSGTQHCRNSSYHYPTSPIVYADNYECDGTVLTCR